MFNLCFVVLYGCEYPCCLYSLSTSGVMWGIPPSHVFLATLDSWRYFFTTTGPLSLSPRLVLKLGIFLCMVGTLFQWNFSYDSKPSLCTAHLWIPFPESTLLNSLRIVYNLIELCWTYGYRLVTGCVARVSVAPLNGEQPVPGTPSCRFPCYN